MVIDTIVAPATPAGRGGVAIVRLSGPLVREIAVTLLLTLPLPRHATYTRFLTPQQEMVDEGIALFFPAPHSFTGEDVLELHTHGGPIIVDNLLHVIISCGARIAKPGEFSERAFLNNKLDLTQAEAIADLINASSTQAARSALRSLQGDFSKLIKKLVESIIHLRIYVEAAIDFAEEEIDFLADQQLAIDLNQILLDLDQIYAAANQGCLLREGINAVIAGPPNAGKSSLLNCLSGKDIAIVTEIPGTTRDVLRDYITIDGLPMHIMDTAGLRESEDIVEQEGIRRAREEIEQADIILFVTDASQPYSLSFSHFVPSLKTKAKMIKVRNKIDLINESVSAKEVANEIIISLSVKEKKGIDLLKKQIKSCVGLENQTEGLFSARRRHLDALNRAKIQLQKGYEQLHHHRAGELLAEDLRQAQLALNEITGEFTSDDLLGRIFSSFCIGK